MGATAVMDGDDIARLLLRTVADYVSIRSKFDYDIPSELFAIAEEISTHVSVGVRLWDGLRQLQSRDAQHSQRVENSWTAKRRDFFMKLFLSSAPRDIRLRNLPPLAVAFTAECYASEEWIRQSVPHIDTLLQRIPHFVENHSVGRYLRRDPLTLRAVREILAKNNTISDFLSRYEAAHTNSLQPETSDGKDLKNAHRSLDIESATGKLFDACAEVVSACDGVGICHTVRADFKACLPKWFPGRPKPEILQCVNPFGLQPAFGDSLCWEIFREMACRYSGQKRFMNNAIYTAYPREGDLDAHMRLVTPRHRVAELARRLFGIHISFECESWWWMVEQPFMTYLHPQTRSQA